MDYQAINIDKIIDNEFIQLLLKNDVVIYGKFIRDIIIDNKSLEDYSKDYFNVINCYSKYVYMDIIERDIYKYLTGKVSIEQAGIKHNNIITYEITVEGNKFILDMIYIRSLNGYSVQSFENDLNCSIDIDSLCLKRTGLNCLDIFGNLPFPFITVINNIKNKNFTFKSRDIILNSGDQIYIKSLLKEGYKNNNSRLYDVVESDKLSCSICYDDSDSSKKYTKLSCGHIYHTECIKEGISTYFSEQTAEYYKCPYCSQKYFHTEIL